MEFDFENLDPQGRYRLLTNFVGPRPIALVTTRSPDGCNNAAPMSFFNVFSHDPAIVILGIQPRLTGEEKDTLAKFAGHRSLPSIWSTWRCLSRC